MSFVVYNWTPILIPFVIGIKNYKRFSFTLKILFVFVAYGTLNEILGFLWRMFPETTNNLPQSHLYLMVTFFVLSLFYRSLLKEIIEPLIFTFIIVLFETACVVNLLFFQTIWEYPSLMQTISKIVYISYAVLFFHRTMVEAKIRNLWQEPIVLINLAVLIYYSANLFFSLLFNHILEYSREFSKLTLIHFSVFNAIFYILIATGFWKAGKKKQVQQ